MTTPNPDPASDEALMRAYLNGDSLAFETLYARHSAKVYGYLKKKLGQREITDEVFQAVFLKLHTTRDNYDSRYPFTQWLFVIARTTLLDHFRKTGRQVPLADEPFDAENVPAPSQEPPQAALGEMRGPTALKGLPAEQRQAIELRVLDELSYEEIAARLKRSQASVRQLVSRGLRKLRSEI